MDTDVDGQPERRLFDLGADDGWQPPANAPKAVLPPWMRAPEQVPPGAAAPAPDDADFAAMVAADLATETEAGLTVSFGLDGAARQPDAGQPDAGQPDADEPVARPARRARARSAAPAAGSSFQVRRVGAQPVELERAEGQVGAVRLSVRVPSGGPVWTSPAAAAAAGTATGTEPVPAARSLPAQGGPVPVPVPVQVPVPMPTPGQAAASVPAQATRHRSAGPAPSLQPSLAPAVVDVVEGPSALAPAPVPPGLAVAPVGGGPLRVAPARVPIAPVPVAGVPVAALPVAALPVAALPAPPPSGPARPRPGRPVAGLPAAPPKAPPKNVPMPLAGGGGGRGDRYAESRDGAPRAPRRRLRRAVAAVLVLGLGGGGAAYVLDGRGDLDRVVNGTAAAQARDWVLANAGASATILAPAASVVDLTDHGTDPTRLVGFHDGSSGPRLDEDCCTLLVVTSPDGAKARAGLPTNVRKAYDRSRLVAAFDRGGQQAEVRQILAVSGPAEVATAVESERKILAAAGREMADNDRMQLSPAARDLLEGGDVDPRLGLALIALTARYVLSVADFPAEPGEGSTGVPRRAVAIDSVDGSAVAPGGSAVAEIREFLAQRKAPYKADLVRTGELAGSSVLRISFRAPSPLGLLASAR